MTTNLPDSLAAESLATPVIESEATPTADDNADEQAESQNTEAPAATVKSPIRTTIKVVPEDEPYLPGQCTVSIVLTLQPGDGHPDGRQVLIGVRSHDEEPLIGLARLNTLSLPGEIVHLLERYELSLSALGQARAERETQEKAKQEQAKKTAKGAKAEVSKPTKKSLLVPPTKAPQPAVPATPSTPAAEGTSPTSDTAPAPAPAAQITLFG